MPRRPRPPPLLLPPPVPPPPQQLPPRLQPAFPERARLKRRCLGLRCLLRAKATAPNSLQTRRPRRPPEETAAGQRRLVATMARVTRVLVHRAVPRLLRALGAAGA